MNTLSIKALSPLLQTVTATATDFWNDSCSIAELDYALAHGAVGATASPSTALAMLRRDLSQWQATLTRLIADHAEDAEDAIAWKLIEEMVLRSADMLLAVFEREQGVKGRLAIETNPVDYRNKDRLIEQAVHFAALAPNIQVGLPVTTAGVAAIEEATYRGVTVNAGVCFTLAQAIAAAEAIERGLVRRVCRGFDISAMAPTCTILVGDVDDWLKALARRDGIITTPGHLERAGIAVIKKAYGIFQDRGYRVRLLAAGYRHHLHWSELIGGDLILTIPHQWQVLFNRSDIVVKERMRVPVDPAIIDELRRKFPDFCRAYDEDGLTVDEFDGYGATIRRLRILIEQYRDLLGIVRDAMLPPPDNN